MTGPDPVSIARRKQVTVPRRLRRFLALDDFEGAARRLLPRAIYGYVSGGVETDASLQANRAAFRNIGFRPRILQDVAGRDQRTRHPFRHRAHGVQRRGGL